MYTHGISMGLLRTRTNMKVNATLAFFVNAFVFSIVAANSTLTMRLHGDHYSIVEYN